VYLVKKNTPLKLLDISVSKFPLENQKKFRRFCELDFNSEDSNEILDFFAENNDLVFELPSIENGFGLNIMNMYPVGDEDIGYDYIKAFNGPNNELVNFLDDTYNEIFIEEVTEDELEDLFRKIIRERMDKIRKFSLQDMTFMMEQQLNKEEKSQQKEEAQQKMNQDVQVNDRRLSEDEEITQKLETDSDENLEEVPDENKIPKMREFFNNLDNFFASFIEKNEVDLLKKETIKTILDNMHKLRTRFYSQFIVKFHKVSSGATDPLISFAKKYNVRNLNKIPEKIEAGPFIQQSLHDIFTKEFIVFIENFWKTDLPDQQFLGDEMVDALLEHYEEVTGEEFDLNEMNLIESWTGENEEVNADKALYVIIHLIKKQFNAILIKDVLFLLAEASVNEFCEEIVGIMMANRKYQNYNMFEIINHKIMLDWPKLMRFISIDRTVEETYFTQKITVPIFISSKVDEE
jgi:hypothetical protein